MRGAGASLFGTLRKALLIFKYTIFEYENAKTPTSSTIETLRRYRHGN